MRTLYREGFIRFVLAAREELLACPRCHCARVKRMDIGFDGHDRDNITVQRRAIDGATTSGLKRGRKLEQAETRDWLLRLQSCQAEHGEPTAAQYLELGARPVDKAHRQGIAGKLGRLGRLRDPMGFESHGWATRYRPAGAIREFECRVGFGTHR